MQSETLAPWADLVPRDGLMTAEELSRLPDDGWSYELVEGRLVRMPPTKVGPSMISVRLGVALYDFVFGLGLGFVTIAEGGYRISAPGQRDTILAPDVGFVRTSVVPDPTSTEADVYWPAAPDLAVEIASHWQYRPAMAAKAQRYLAAGSNLVWVIWPKWRQVYVWHPGDDQPTAVLTTEATLDGENVLPGFSYPVARLFG